jgi:hypothetical protein
LRKTTGFFEHFFARQVFFQSVLSGGSSNALSVPARSKTLIWRKWVDIDHWHIDIGLDLGASEGTGMDRDVDSQSAGSQNCRLAEASAHLPRAFARAIDRLLKARNYAEEAGRNIWEFAVTITELRRDGVSENDLRWLVCRAYIEHAKEITRGCGERKFNRQVSLRLCKRSAFVITDAGVAYSRSFPEGFTRCDIDTEVGVNFAYSAPEMAPSTVTLDARRSFRSDVRPKWDRDRRELRLADELVKVFKLPSPMQEAILMAFEEEQWPPRIDDPLPVHPDMLPKRRLHDTIKSLNRNQKSPLIRFMGDGTGEGIRWELTAAKEQPEHLVSLLG